MLNLYSLKGFLPSTSWWQCLGRQLHHLGGTRQRAAPGCAPTTRCSRNFRHSHTSPLVKWNQSTWRVKQRCKAQPNLSQGFPKRWLAWLIHLYIDCYLAINTDVEWCRSNPRNYRDLTDLTKIISAKKETLVGWRHWHKGVQEYMLVSTYFQLMVYNESLSQ